MILISLIVSAVAVIYFLLGFIDTRNKAMQLLQLNILCIAFLTIISVIYQSKISTYTSFFKIDYDLYQMFYSIRIPVRILSTLHNLGIIFFLIMSISNITVFGNTAQRMKYFIALIIPLILIAIINMPDISWKIFLHSQTNNGYSNLFLNFIMKSNYTLSKSIVIIYLLLPFAFFIKDHKNTSVGIKKNKIKFSATYLLIINTFFYVVFVQGVFRNIIFFNTNEANLPIDTTSADSSYVTQILYLAFMICFVIFLVLHYLLSSSWFRTNKYNLLKGSYEIDKRSNMLFHIYKNAFIGIQRQSALVEQCIENEKYDNALKNSKYCCEIAKTHINMLNKSISMLYKISPNLTNVKFSDCLDDAVKRASVPKNIKLIYNDNSTKDTFILADKYYLTEVLINVIINSVTALEKKGHNNPSLTFDISYETDYGILKITDNGIGVSDEDIKKIFSLFFSTDYNTNHSGIGLYYAKKIISQMYGEIVAKSEYEKYFTMKIALPLYKKQSKNQEVHNG